MANKIRTPDPPRRPVQAPKLRVEARKPLPRWLFPAVGGGGVLVAVVVVVLVVVLGGGDDGAGACKRQTFSPQGRSHVGELKKGFSYNSFPATSGPHHPVPAIWNVYDRPVAEIHLVHNLEHGGVAVQYGRDVPRVTVEAIADWYRDDPSGLVVGPLPKLGKRIVLTAWTQLATCTAFSEGEFSDFRDDYRFKGPEPVPPESMAPGT